MPGSTHDLPDAPIGVPGGALDLLDLPSDLDEAVAAYREALKEYRRERVPLYWAATQTNLGNALRGLGEREKGTARLDEAVAAYREALKEYTRDRVPLNWATTQHNLGSALSMLGNREKGTARLSEAVAAYREALKERTWQRAPLEWAITHNSLGIVFFALAERGSGTAWLDEAVVAYSEALEEFKSGSLQELMTKRNLDKAEKKLATRKAAEATSSSPRKGSEGLATSVSSETPTAAPP